MVDDEIGNDATHASSDPCSSTARSSTNSIVSAGARNNVAGSLATGGSSGLGFSIRVARRRCAGSSERT